MVKGVHGIKKVENHWDIGSIQARNQLK